MKGLFVQMTGLSGAGKTTLATNAASRLRKKGFKVEVIDGDEYRDGLCSDLGFSKEDRNTNIRRLGFVGKILARNGVIVIMSAINPYEKIRQEIEGKVAYIKCDLDVVIERDTKGLYAKALSGEIENFTGISDPFEEPEFPDLVIDTGEEHLVTSANKLYEFILGNLK
jgi:adenylylsulfate kinase|tara:strand:+ start:134 stop:637 length:504 start_codon:yes stop_codon:yes gene_type:complete